MRLWEMFITEENKAGKITKRQQNSTVGLNKFTDGQKWNGDYTAYRLGLALGMTDGKEVPKLDSESWVGRWKTAHPYTPEEQEMFKLAYQAVGAKYEDLNNGDLRSEELKTTNKISPVPKPKRNKYGV
jgi:hypothetical protein